MSACATPSPRRRFRLLPLLALILGLGWGCGGGEKELILLHTNDIHAWFAPFDGELADGSEARFGGAPVLASLVRGFREQHPGSVLYLDAGDVFQGTPISTLSKGKACVEVMNLLAPDAFELGNHEYDYGLEAQRKAFQNATFPILQGNVRMAGHAQPFYPSDLLLNKNGLQVAVLGLNTDALFAMSAPWVAQELKLDSSQVVAKRWLQRVAQADLKIILSHNGFEADSLLALALPDIDLIVGGHSHTVLEQPVQVGETWILQAGDRGRYLGAWTVGVKPGEGITRCEGELIPVLEGAAEPAADVAAAVEAHEAEVNAKLGATVAILTSDWTTNARGESAQGNWLCAALRQATGARIGLWNSGGIRKGAKAGPLTERDFWEISPFGNEIVVGEVLGGRLLELFNDEVKRGGLHLHFDGLRVGADEQGGVGSMLVGGEPLNTGKTYSAAMSDFLWNQIRRPGDPEPRRTGLLDRDVLIAQARAEGQIKLVTDGRWGPGRTVVREPEVEPAP